MTCKRCIARGKTWQGTDPKCAFERGVFSPDNYACDTMLQLRGLVSESVACADDQHAALLPLDDGTFLLLGWYKRRGRTELARIVDETRTRPLTLKQAEEILAGKKVAT